MACTQKSSPEVFGIIKDFIIKKYFPTLIPEMAKASRTRTQLLVLFVPKQKHKQTYGDF